MCVLGGFRPVYAQQAPQGDAPSISYLQTALKTLESSPIHDVSLSLQANRIAGSSNETVSATFEAVVPGSTRLVYQMSNGPLTETRLWSANAIRTGNWIDPKGASHTISYHNMMTEPFWFFPAMIVEHTLGGGTQFVSYIGPDTFNEVAVQHLRTVAIASSASNNTQQIQILSQTELYLDAGTLLPVGVTFKDHPDSTLTVDIPVKVVFSAYQSMSGTLVPTHVQQFRNNALTLDLHIQNATVNTGVTLTSPVE
jgi:hypothetical protein